MSCRDKATSARSGEYRPIQEQSKGTKNENLLYDKEVPSFNSSSFVSSSLRLFSSSLHITTMPKMKKEARIEQLYPEGSGLVYNHHMHNYFNGPVGTAVSSLSLLLPTPQCTDTTTAETLYAPALRVRRRVGRRVQLPHAQLLQRHDRERCNPPRPLCPVDRY